MKDVPIRAKKHAHKDTVFLRAYFFEGILVENSARILAGFHDSLLLGGGVHQGSETM